VDGFAEHDRAHRWWADTLNSDSRVGLGAPTLFGFLRLATNDKVLDPPLRTSLALSHVRDWLDRPNVSFLAPGRQHLEIAFGLLDRLGTAGNLTTDVQIAASAIEHEGVVHSHDSDFGRLPQVRWVDPLR
jgi:hypothetical protein